MYCEWTIEYLIHIYQFLLLFYLILLQDILTRMSKITWIPIGPRLVFVNTNSK